MVYLRGFLIEHPAARGPKQSERTQRCTVGKLIKRTFDFSQPSAKKRSTMKKNIQIILPLTFLLVLLLTACQGMQSEQGPTEAYQSYYEHCQSEQYELAEGYLSEDARTQVAVIGVCGFTHDAINRIEAERGGIQRVFSEDPEFEINEDSAVMSWIDDQGYLAIVHLLNTEDGWKVAYTVWSN
jgi:hypothetical protein